MIFKVKNLTKCYNQKIVVKGFSYDFYPGLYLFTGRNGSGKSTVLKMIANVIFPSNYTYQKSFAKITYLCEHIDLLNIKVVEFLTLFSKLCKRKKDFNLQLKNWKIPNKKMLNLSKGNKQKVGILMMLLNDSDIYLFDEPTDALDDSSIILFQNEIKTLLDKDKIIIIATHEKRYFDGFRYQEITFDQN